MFFEAIQKQCLPSFFRSVFRHFCSTIAETSLPVARLSMMRGRHKRLILAHRNFPRMEAMNEPRFTYFLPLPGANYYWKEPVAAMKVANPCSCILMQL